GSTGEIHVYDGSGALVDVWGGPGPAAGQLGGVIAMDLGPGGNVLVLDTYNRVQEFTQDGTFVRGAPLPACAGGASPSAPGLGGLDAAGTTVWVSSPCSDVVYRLNADLSVASQFPVAAPRGLYAQNSRLYVARWNASDVAIYDFSGQLQGTRPVGGQPTDVFADIYNVLHVADITHDVIHMYGGDGVEFRTLGRPGSNPGDIEDVYQFDVVPQTGASGAGDLLLADYNNARLQRWNSYGSTLFATKIDGGSAPPPPPPPPPPGARVGVTLNDAAAFSGSRAVTLTITPLTGATGVVISNDGGFGTASELPLSADRHYAWTLATTGAERLPKTVYVRFTGGGVDDTKTFTDDIVLDLRPPSIVSASQSQGGARAVTAAVRMRTIRVKAKDSLSGVASLQFAATPKAKRIDNVRYRRTVRIPAAQAHYVRAIDRAGNAGRWKKIKP
ncbi:MAG: Ig family protein, partial [Solirubrobacterales bacterium]|nr:Ig family protein [Solirubrobacterales bacterium]